MAHQMKDPVCGMTVDMDSATDRAEFQGRTYYFCSPGCVRQFRADPARYANVANSSESRAADKAATGQEDVALERHEPSFTKSGGMVAPKFGSAGSGGLEYERLPEAHDDVKRP